jgi:hypothetical protein
LEQKIVQPSSETVGGYPLRAETGQHVSPRQGCQFGESSDTETLEEIHQILVSPTQRLKGQRFQPSSGLARRYDPDPALRPSSILVQPAGRQMRCEKAVRYSYPTPFGASCFFRL